MKHLQFATCQQAHNPHDTFCKASSKWVAGLYSNSNPHAATADFSFEEWVPPNFHAAYRDALPALSDRPLLIMHNKYTNEWGEAPTNFIDIPTLMRLMDMLKGHYTIIYMRPYTGQHLRGYVGDAMESLDREFDDHEQIKQHHPEVLLAHELLEQHPEMQDFNELQLALHAQAGAFISVLGGNAVISSYFAGTNIIYAVKGQEASNDEFRNLYPRLSPDGLGKIFQAHDYEELVSLAEQHFLGQQALEM